MIKFGIIALVVLLWSGSAFAAGATLSFLAGSVAADGSTTPDHFNVYTSTTFGVTWTKINTTVPYVPNQTAYSTIDPTGVVGQCYKITAENFKGESPSSNVACLASSTASGAAAPNAPKSLNVIAR